MNNISLITIVTIVVLIGIAIISVVVALRYDKEGNSKLLGETANSLFSLILSSLWLPFWLFVQWLVGIVLKVFPVDESNEIFFEVFRYVFAGVTLIFVLIEVGKNVIIAYKAAKKELLNRTINKKDQPITSGFIVLRRERCNSLSHADGKMMERF